MTAILRILLLRLNNRGDSGRSEDRAVPREDRLGLRGEALEAGVEEHLLQEAARQQHVGVARQQRAHVRVHARAAEHVGVPLLQRQQHRARLQPTPARSATAVSSAPHQSGDGRRCQYGMMPSKRGLIG